MVHTRPVRIIFFVFLTVVGAYVLLSPPPHMSAGPASKLASFSREQTFTGVWEDLRQGRIFSYRAQNQVRDNPGEALSNYRKALTTYRLARKKAREERYFKKLIDGSIVNTGDRIDGLQQRLNQE